ncbi:MAG TPA: hypothetical protein VFV33_01425 [Gemmatimonadaceae bacterium]|nr:hypothetical protein [Gemmatimonadaceae bacterium]
MLLDADRLLAIGNTRRVRSVVLGGRVLDQDALKRRMDQAAAEAARTKRPRAS